MNDDVEFDNLRIYSSMFHLNQLLVVRNLEYERLEPQLRQQLANRYTFSGNSMSMNIRTFFPFKSSTR
jgi:hypothetical protein